MATPGIEPIPDNTSTNQVLTGGSVDEASQTELRDHQKSPSLPRPMRIYTRPQILFLHRSPLVYVPHNMPELKEWFGSEAEQTNSKKDAEPSTPSSARDRRFRRDPEDDTPSRPTFRSTLSQPSQMGNFKHQSLRPSDRDRERDRERDGEKDRQRDIRDKEGQEKLRHLSDKYDRERNKERDTAPHLPAGSTSRVGPQSQLSATSSRRAETRESTKKKAGEASEDWRRGAEARSTRDEKSDGGRKDRDDRERPRSRVRDASRSRRDPSNSRRDREDRDRIRGDRERDDFRRDKDRDLDRDSELEDPRRWRDDGKREERMAARRGERNSDQLRDRERPRERDPAWDTSGGRHWMVVEERDSRSKRAAGRERKGGLMADDGKDRERERDKEKEPAWMDTYIPDFTSGGILGGKGAEGELDGIQAWKKGLKEKELKDKNLTMAKGNDGEANYPTNLEKPATSSPLDEIQLFRLMMKREEEKKKGDSLDGGLSRVPEGSAPTGEKSVTSLTVSRTLQTVSNDNSLENTTPTPTEHPNNLPNASNYIQPTGDSVTRSFVESKDSPNALNSAGNHLSELSMGTSKTPPTFGAIPNHSSRDTDRSSPDPTSLQFNPPPGSRLLAFARAPSGRPQPTSNTSDVGPNGALQNARTPPQPETTFQDAPKSDGLRSLPGFSPFEDHTRASFGLDERRDLGNFANPNAAHRGSAERLSFTQTAEHGPFHETPPSLENGTGYSANKGSRFAKFFDGKTRENAPHTLKLQPPVGYMSPSPNLAQRQDNSGISSSHGGDHRAMDDIYAMLNSSTQGHRGASPNTAPLSNNLPYGQQALLQQQQHLHQQHQQQIHGGRLEPLYESRLDDRNFMPDGMVPGLRSAPPPRNRENIGMYPEVPDDSMHFNVQRLPQQQRSLDQVYGGPPMSMYVQQAGRNTGIPMQHPNFRGAPSPISNQQSSVQTLQQQRLPPGLANLGGRPPHEPSQFLGMPGMPSPGLHGVLHLNGPTQQPFNNFTPGNNVGYGGGPHLRGPPQLQNPAAHHHMGGLGHPSNMDMRAANLAQLIGPGGGGVRGSNGGFSGQQVPQMQGPIAMRQQQQQLPPHIISHLPPHPHLQQGLSGPNNQPHDLMALLMGGSHRE